jgi:hypothetical protein
MDRIIHPALEGKPVVWFAHKLAASVWRELQNRRHHVTRDSNQQEQRLEVRGGGTLDVFPTRFSPSGAHNKPR